MPATSARVGRARCDLLSLTGEEVLGLSDVHPEPSEVKRVQLLVGGDGGEDFLFDGSGAQLHVSAKVSAGSFTHLDAVQDAGVEHVDAGVDPVADKLDGLLDEAVDDRGAGLGDDDTVGRRLGDLGNLTEISLGSIHREASRRSDSP